MSNISFISQKDADALNDEFFRLHATFARPITIWKTAKQIVLSTNPSNNFLFESTPFNDQVQNIQVSGVFNARVQYPKKMTTVPFVTLNTKDKGGMDQVFIQRDEGDVRIKVDATGMAYLMDAKRVTLDGDIFDIAIAKRPHSLLGAPKFYDFLLTRIN
jgi:hypothetical protein